MDKVEHCAVCGSAELNMGKNSQQEAYVNCVECGLTLRLATWNRLSRAARLLAAVERLGNRGTTAITPLGMLRIDEIHILPEQGSGQWVAVCDGRMTARHVTIADALIALAEEVSL